MTVGKIFSRTKPLMREYFSKQFGFNSFDTALCYGQPDVVPIPIDAPTRPFPSYGISKTAASDLPFLPLQLANVTGPRLAIGPIPTFYVRLKAGQSCFCFETQRDFIDMSDFFSLIYLVLAKGAPTSIYNVSTGQAQSIADIFRNRYSWKNIVIIRLKRLLHPHYRSKSQQQALNMNDGDACPLALVYSKPEARELLSGFAGHRFRLNQLSWKQLLLIPPLARAFDRILPSCSNSPFARMLGWNLCIEAVKPPGDG